MCNPERLEAIAKAHRALAARHEALFQISKVMFALIPDVSGVRGRLLAAAKDATLLHMQMAGHDQEYCQLVQRSMAEICDLLKAADSTADRPTL